MPARLPNQEADQIVAARPNLTPIRDVTYDEALTQLVETADDAQRLRDHPFEVTTERPIFAPTQFWGAPNETGAIPTAGFQQEAGPETQTRYTIYKRRITGVISRETDWGTSEEPTFEGDRIQVGESLRRRLTAEEIVSDFNDRDRRSYHYYVIEEVSHRPSQQRPLTGYNSAAEEDARVEAEREAYRLEVAQDMRRRIEERNRILMSSAEPRTVAELAQNLRARQTAAPDILTDRTHAERLADMYQEFMGTAAAAARWVAPPEARALNQTARDVVPTETLNQRTADWVAAQRAGQAR